MVDRQKSYESLIDFIFDEYFDLDIERSISAEAMLPDVRVDKLVQIPKEALKKAEDSPFPFLEELSLFHIKGINDHLTRGDIVQYLGQLYVMATSAMALKKGCCLVIFTAEKISKGVESSIKAKINRTKTPWIYEFEGTEEKAYIFELKKELLEKKEYRFFLPFFPLPVIKEKKEVFIEIAKGGAENKRDLRLLDWLREVHPGFYNEEIGNMKSMEEVIRGICPEALEEVEINTRKAAILEALEVRFGAIPEGIKEKIMKENRKEVLNGLFKKALQAASIAEFEEQLE